MYLSFVNEVVFGEYSHIMVDSEPRVPNHTASYRQQASRTHKCTHTHTLQELIRIKSFVCRDYIQKVTVILNDNPQT